MREVSSSSGSRRRFWNTLGFTTCQGRRTGRSWAADDVPLRNSLKPWSVVEVIRLGLLSRSCPSQRQSNCMLRQSHFIWAPFHKSCLPSLLQNDRGCRREKHSGLCVSVMRVCFLGCFCFFLMVKTCCKETNLTFYKDTLSFFQAAASSGVFVSYPVLLIWCTTCTLQMCTPA